MNDIENGGLKMLDLDSMVLAQRIIALKKNLDTSVNSWKVILDEFLKGVGGKFILSCNFATSKITDLYSNFLYRMSWRVVKVNFHKRKHVQLCGCCLSNHLE